MAFHQEPRGYQKTLISDLQGAWGNLRDAVVQEHEHQDCTRLLFHIDEAMSWESVRDLKRMKETLVLIQSLAQQRKVPDEVMGWLEEVRGTLEEVLEKIRRGQQV
jgi:hypothetical protein